MPTVNCPTCNKQFKNISAAQQHARDKAHATPSIYAPSPPPPPVSVTISPPAWIPGPYPCTICQANFASEALRQLHYRGSSIHPTCARCLHAFRDNEALNAHISIAHHVRCGPCNVIVFRDELAQHYLASSNHPTCGVCDVGYENDRLLDEHTAAAHPELRCAPCNLVFRSAQGVRDHYGSASSGHPRCTSCDMGFKDGTSYDEHMSVFHPPPPPSPPQEPVVVVPTPETPELLSIPVRTFIEDVPPQDTRSTTPASEAAAFGLLSTPFTPRSRQSTHLTLMTELPTPATANSTNLAEFRRSILGESSNSSSSPARRGAVSEPTLPSASSLRGNSGIVSQTPTSPAMTERTLDYIRSSAMRASNVISRLSRTPSPALSKNLSLRGLRHKRTPSVSSDSLQSMHTSDINSDANTHDYDTLSSHEAEHPPQIQALLTPAEIEARGTKTPERHARVVDASKTPTCLPDPPSSSRSAAMAEAETPRRRVSVPTPSTSQTAPTPVRTFSRSSRLSSLRRSVSTASRLSVHGVSDDTDVTIREAPKPTERTVRTQAAPKGLSWHCRVCQRDPCEQPTATMCGHIFCHSCIIKELAESMQCPVCKKTMLLRLHVEAD